MFENKGLLLLYKQSDGYLQKLREFINPYITGLVKVKTEGLINFQKNGEIIFNIRENKFNPVINHCEVNPVVWYGLSNVGLKNWDIEDFLRVIINEIGDGDFETPHIYFSVGYHSINYEYRDSSYDYDYEEVDGGFETFYTPKITSKNIVGKKGKQNKISNSVHAPPR